MFAVCYGPGSHFKRKKGNNIIKNFWWHDHTTKFSWNIQTLNFNTSDQSSPVDDFTCYFTVVVFRLSISSGTPEKNRRGFHVSNIYLFIYFLFGLEFLRGSTHSFDDEFDSVCSDLITFLRKFFRWHSRFHSNVHLRRIWKIKTTGEEKGQNKTHFLLS